MNKYEALVKTIFEIAHAIDDGRSQPEMLALQESLKATLDQFSDVPNAVMRLADTVEAYYREEEGKPSLAAYARNVEHHMRNAARELGRMKMPAVFLVQVDDENGQTICRVLQYGEAPKSEIVALVQMLVDSKGDIGQWLYGLSNYGELGVQLTRENVKFLTWLGETLERASRTQPDEAPTDHKHIH